jgi:hypothetical protein
MPSAKPVVLTVRPFEVSNLCFEVGGILGESFAELGSTVSAFDFGFFYKAFRAATPSKAVEHPGRLAFDSDAIDLATKVAPLIVVKNVPQPSHPKALAALRAEPLRAALDKAINARANAVITKYANAGAIIGDIADTAKLKEAALAQLRLSSNIQTETILREYVNDDLQDVVVKDITSNSTTRSIVRDRQMLETKTTNSDVDATGKEVVTSRSKSTVESMPKPPSTIEEVGHQFTNTATRQIEYRVPSLECRDRHARAQMMLRDEQFANLLETLSLETPWRDLQERISVDRC